MDHIFRVGIGQPALVTLDVDSGEADKAVDYLILIFRVRLLTQTGVTLDQSFQRIVLSIDNGWVLGPDRGKVRLLRNPHRD